MIGGALQTAAHLLYPPQCLGCSGLVETDFGLCGPCWRDTLFLGGVVCDLCGTALIGDAPDGIAVHCDECMRVERPWTQGRAAVAYKDTGRALVLKLKHGDRHDIAGPASDWMARVSGPLIRPDMVVAPVPLHWTRVLKRRYNQSGLLAQHLAARLGLVCIPDLLQRRVRTPSLDGKTAQDRFAILQNALFMNPRYADRIQGKPVLLVDDVMTSGATLAAAADVCRTSQAGEVCVVTLARVAKDT